MRENGISQMHILHCINTDRRGGGYPSARVLKHVHVFYILPVFQLAKLIAQPATCIPAQLYLCPQQLLLLTYKKNKCKTC